MNVHSFMKSDEIFFMHISHLYLVALSRILSTFPSEKFTEN